MVKIAPNADVLRERKSSGRFFGTLVLCSDAKFTLTGQDVLVGTMGVAELMRVTQCS